MKQKRVKLITMIALALCAVLTLAACGSGGSEEPAQTEASAQTETSAQTEAPVSTEAPAQTQAHTEAGPETEAAPETAVPEAASVPDAPSASDDDPYVGTYVEPQGQRATMEITTDGRMYFVTVDWSSGPEDHSQWTFSGSFDENGEMEYFNGLKTVTQPDEEGDLIPVLDYNYGMGTIRMTAEGIVWEDEQEHIADGLVFEAQ